MKNQILTLNSGSTSLKYKLFDFGLKELKNGFIEDIGKDKIKNHAKALEKVAEEIGETENIKYVGHRVVHGGNEFYHPTVVDKKVFKKIAKFNHLAPLHNPANLEGIKASMCLIKRAINVAVFDTAFYKHLPEHAFLYAIPREFYKKYGIRRYGFHGISHKYAMLEASEILKKPTNKLKLITCHLGGGASATAIKNGRAIDTSMGFTPMEGIPMATRCGDIDPGIIIELIKNKNIKIKRYTSGERIDDINYLLNYESGLKGLAGIESNSVYEISHTAAHGDKEMMNVLRLYAYRIKKYIGAYKAVLGGVDAVVFTGTIGYKSNRIRKLIISGFKDLQKIEKLVIKTDEELMIAREIVKLFKIS
ncbi:MAG: acetate/propionate family kinase [Patescibacteria group bacterium]|nr:acetate/propionate family kinase [Patescibacteria group bacterium]